MNSLGYVFIPGGAMSSWVWKDLDHRFQTNAVLIRGRLKENNYQNRIHASPADCVDHIEERIIQAGYKRVIIVAHSGGGLLAPLVAKRTKVKVEKIVFVSANIPKHGTSTLQNLPILVRLINKIAAKKQMKTDFTPACKMEKVIRKIFCNTASEEVIEYVLRQQLITEPLCVFYEKADWNAVPRIPMTFIRLLNDKMASLKLQDRMAANLDISEKYDIDSDHMVMLSHPKQFNEVLNFAFAK
jgi:pimeloyl-ACP methyl ester carboxylesterase